ncbi:PAS domain S-box protein [Oscillatoria sp. FACHB-1406]|uniref:PAS domain S-box protein n=1 Tax=Oscillatoria sp. FACHB-1406 TaxID=2692846 RepID=UPI001687A99D|nr:PAS domain S-box protein [Oscillatoria sp. FACHB-1406]MBD2576653.1 PAS domain S-box protein [Oscillatoria sp. FACHB-1406]
MPIKTPRLSLPLLLASPYLLATLFAVGLTSYYYFRSGQNAVRDSVLQWQKERTVRVAKELKESFEIPAAIAQDTAKDFQSGYINAERTKDLIHQFQHQRSLFESMREASIYLGTAQGKLIGLGYQTANPNLIALSDKSGNLKIYETDAIGNPKVEIAQQPATDPRLQPWYLRALTTTKPVWGESEYDAIAQQRKLVLSQGLYNPSGQLEGVIAIDYSLSDLDRTLQRLKIGSRGKVFILDRALHPIASSVAPNTDLDPALAQQIRQQFGTIETIRDVRQISLKLDGQQYWLSLVPFSRNNGSHWWIAVLTAESDFLAPFYTTERHSILLLLATSAAAVALGVAIARQIARPIRRLQEATTQIASGDWQQRIELNRDDELGDLAKAFNSMAEQLQTAFAQLQALNQTVLESENRLLQFLEVLPVGVSVHNTAGEPLYMNQAARDLWEVDPGEMKTTQQFVETGGIYLAGTPHLYPFERFPVTKALQGEPVNAEDLELRRGDIQGGRVIPLEMRSAPIVTPTGEVAYALATFLDISERKRAEQVLLHYNRTLEKRVEERTAALAKAEAELKSLFAAMQEVVIVLDKEGRYQRVISKQEELLAQPKNELLQRTIYDVVSAEEADRFFEALQQVISTQQALDLDYHLEIKGRTFWFEASISPYLKDSAVLVARDVSDRQVLEEKVRTSEARMRAVLEAIPDIILIIDERQNIEVSPTNFIYLCASNINWLSLTVEQFWSEENGELWFSLVRQARERQEVVNFDYRFRESSETEVWFAAQIAPLPNNSVIWVARDISERKAAEVAIFEAKEAAEAASRAKSTFVANMSHELRSPLNAILGFAQLLARSPDMSSERREYANIITRSGEHLLGLIDQVLNLSKIEAGRAQLNEIDFDLIRELDNLEDLFSLKAEEKGLDFRIERDRNVPQYVCCDRLKLRQIAINLLGNSIKFTPVGRVTLRLTALEASSGDRQLVRLEVEDTGPGIEPDEFDCLFESFQQTRTGRQLQEGTGVGLSIVREFVQLMGGSITVSSGDYTYNPDTPPAVPRTAPAATTTFSVTLPMLPIESVESDENSPLPHKGTEKRIALAPNQPQYRILVADDKDYNRKLLVQLLAPVGFTVREASNGEEAIALWESWQPHLIWIDLRMPILDGYQATRYIKAHLRDLKTIIIALTASPLEEELAELRSAGCDGWMRKPVREQAIFDTLARHLGVQYIYAEEKNTSEGGQLNDSLLLALLERMSSEWRQKLEDAAVMIDDEQIFLLLSEIPAELSKLARILSDWTQTFRCDKIIALIERFNSQNNNH